MNAKKLICGLVAVACCTAFATAQQPDLDKMKKNVLDKSEQSIKDAEKALQASMDDEMKAWMEAGTPSEHHAFLRAMEGNWKVHTKYWMDPNMPAQESEGSCVNKMIFDGRYLQTSFKGNMMGMDFQGTGYMAYNNVSGKYQSVWLDSMSTGMMIEEGSSSESDKVVTMYGTFDCPMRGKCKTKTVTTIEGPDKYTMVMYEMQDDGSEMKSMILTSTRAN